MPRPRKPRKAYRPHPVRLDAHLHAMDRVATLLDAQRTDLRIPMLLAFEAFRTGAGSAAHWCHLADAMNVAQVLAEEKQIASNLADRFNAAQAALAAVHGRRQAGGSYTLRPAELVALDDAVWAAEVQLQHASQGEMADAILIVQRRSAGALAGAVGAGTTVCVGQLGRTDGQTLAVAR